MEESIWYFFSGVTYQVLDIQLRIEWLYRVSHPLMSVKLTFIYKCLLNIFKEMSREARES